MKRKIAITALSIIFAGILPAISAYAACTPWKTVAVTDNRCLQTHCGIWSSTALSQRYTQHRVCDGRTLVQEFERHNDCDC
ncbi:MULTISPECIES: hypothetical protein [unclassified Granulicatella]|uniref:hypothetical protein n=1 Tax=unclassified Granulicatella TaxID=2630493 RepID=UPI00107339E0|nr:MULTISPECIES: hypothetical protein [unclassified Granulicatella]MBF0780953.1 hypothetical protein [Granulicatella sp. 19428wC4_WM01]TFU92974.1 hypothetical protein E4T68_07540 [Granulicatella sp. WM01]